MSLLQTMTPQTSHPANGAGRTTVEPIAGIRVRFEASLSEPRLEVQRLAGLERISAPFRFQVMLSADRGTEEDAETDADKIDLASMISRPAHIEISEDATDGVVLRRIHGAIASCEQMHRSGRATYYQLTIVPRAYRAHLRVNNRIFQGRSTEEIVQQVLEEHGLTSGEDFHFSLLRTTAPRGYCVQYRESDWSFVNRLLEDEGIFYYFAHEDAKDVLVMVDSVQALPPVPGGRDTLEFHPVQETLPPEEHVSAFHFGERFRAGALRLRDWNFQTPDLANDGLMEATLADRDNSAGAEIEVYEYPGGYEDVAVANASLINVRMEELQTGRISASGESTSARLTAGHTFRLEGYYRADRNDVYALTEVYHEISVPPARDLGEGVRCVYADTFRCTPASRMIRPERRTKKPQIAGMQTALVVGPAGEEIFTDAFGRIKVKFHWDCTPDMEEPTCFVRVAQSWAGPGWGAFFLPRIGHEVVVVFEEGDPDRPLVIGSVYFDQMPYPLPAEKTKSTIKSRSTPNAQGSNELRFEDKKGAEEIYLHAQRNLTEVVGANRSSNIGGSDALTVKGNQTVTIEGEGGSGSDRGGKISVTGDWKVDASNTMSLDAPTSITLTCGESSITLEPGKITLMAGGGAKVVLDGDLLAQASGGAKIILDGDAKLSSSAGTEVTLDADATISASANAAINATQIAIAGQSQTEVSGGTGSLKADILGANVSGPQVNISGDMEVSVSGMMVRLN